MKATTLETLFRDAIGWAVAFYEAAESIEEWDRVAAEKATEFTDRARALIERPASADEVRGMDSMSGVASE